MSTEARSIKVANAAPSNSTRADKIAIETTKICKVTAGVAVMSIFGKKKCKSQSANPGNRKPSHQKMESSDFLGENSHKLRNLSQKMRKDQISKKLASKSTRLELNSTNLMLKSKKTCL